MTPEHTDMIGAARLREALERTREALNDYFHKTGSAGEIDRAYAIVSETLAAVPEAPEPVYEWRAVFPNGDGSYSVQPLAKAPRPGTRMLVEGHNRGWVERRHAVAWERVEEGTQR